MRIRNTRTVTTGTYAACTGEPPGLYERIGPAVQAVEAMVSLADRMPSHRVLLG
jgi:hypothetical protein